MSWFGFAAAPLLWAFLLPFNCLVGLVRSVHDICRFTSWVFHPKNKDLYKYGAHSSSSWAVVTGASSGIGEAMAYALCRAGFHLVIVARREDQLLRVKAKVESTSVKCKVRIISADLSDAVSIQDALMKQVEDAIGETGEIRIFMHFAGNSDLAVHFTDKSVKRNVAIMRLVVESTLVLTQRFTELMCSRSARKKCAIVTCGALTAYTPAPTFATSSANKHYVRALTLALAEEFQEIDFMIAHPIAVKSEILNRSEASSSYGFIIERETFVENIIAEMGHSVELNGHWKHDMLVYLLYDVLPLKLVQSWFFKNRVRKNSEFLNRPIDERDVYQKIKGGGTSVN